MLNEEAYTHIQCNSDEHGLSEQNLEWPCNDFIDSLEKRNLAFFEGSPPPVVTRLFPQFLGFAHEEDRTEQMYK